MAFTREFVRNIAKECEVELPKEFINALMDEHITARDAYAKEQVEAAEKNAPKSINIKDSEEYKNLEKSFKDYKAGIQAEKSIADKKAAYRALLKSLGVAENRIDAVLKITDYSKIELDDKGAIKGEKELSENIKTEWADFIVQTKNVGAQTTNPPGNKTQASDKTKEEILAIKDGAVRRQEIANHPELFGLDK